MLKSKKIFTTLILAAIITVGTVIPAFAVTQVSTIDTTNQVGRTILNGSDCWNRGLYDGNNGWYMAYSYYKNYSYRSYVKSSLNGESKIGENAISYTAIANTRSYQTTSGYKVYAGTTRFYN